MLMNFWDVSDEKISRIIDAKDYDAALKYCCLEHDEIIVGVCKPFVEDYPNIALGVLKDDNNLSEAIIKKYFSEFEI